MIAEITIFRKSYKKVKFENFEGRNSTFYLLTIFYLNEKKLLNQRLIFLMIKFDFKK